MRREMLRCPRQKPLRRTVDKGFRAALAVEMIVEEAEAEVSFEHNERVEENGSVPMRSNARRRTDA